MLSVRGVYVLRSLQKLIPTRKRFDLVIAAITRHTSAELLRMDESNNLRKNGFFGEHASRIRDPASSRSRLTFTENGEWLKEQAAVGT